MRPLRLEMRGFAAFRQKTVIDFTDTDYFALVGQTGAGKSTVLDAICFALYGKVPRWGGTSVRDALAPSTNEAAVLLIFSVGGERYAATRVVRRTARGDAQTSQAGLQRVPANADLSRLDESDDWKLGEVLAGSASEMSHRVEEVTGLPFEQFTKCVVLPQGEFAEFLKAKNTERQKILENLLGLDVYKRIQGEANRRASDARAVVDNLDGQLARLGEVSDEQVTAAQTAIEAAKDLDGRVRGLTPLLRDARKAAGTARERLAAVEETLAMLRAVSPPIDLADTVRETTDAEAAHVAAAAEVSAVEAEEERLRAALGEVDTARLIAARAAHDERGKIAANIVKGEELVVRVIADHDRCAAARVKAAERLKLAEEEREEARTRDVAAALRPHLVAGHACPVCSQNVAVLPPPLSAGALEAAERAVSKAREAFQEAEREAVTAGATLRNYQERLDERRAQLAAAEKQLAGAPSPDEIERLLAEAEAHRAAFTAAGQAVNATREKARRAAARLTGVQERMTREWRAFDTARDRVARLDPPRPDRGDLSASWQELSAWTAARLTETEGVFRDVQTEVAVTAEAVDELMVALREILPGHDADDETALLTATAKGVSDAEHHHAALLRQREQAAELRAQREERQAEAQVAKQLADHLGARKFLSWLMRAAVDILVEDASGILLELSGGQYDLMYESDKFFVVDHHDAGQARPAYTLSGGETFAASLALALALSRQLSGMSARGARLESIMLDEGFGTLDASTLDIVATTLEALATRGDRMVGVVTHVPALADRIPVRFEVTKDATGARVEKTIT